MTTKKYKIRSKKMSVTSSSLYDKDFYKWTSTQAFLLNHGEYEKLDIANLVEEMESLGNSVERSLESYLMILTMHLLKMKYQPEKKTRSWEFSIANSTHKIKKLMKKNPSLKSKFNEILKDAYFTARLEAALETELDVKIFPKDCPWDSKTLLNV